MNMKTVAALLFSWYVTTYGGDIVAGPFSDISDCERVARIMAADNPHGSRICKSRF